MESKTAPAHVGALEILSVEDSPSDQALIAHALRGLSRSYQLNFVGDGEEAIRYLRHEGRFANAARPDLILMDLSLPTMHGHDVLRAIREDEKLRDIPVMVLSTSTSQDDILKCQALHANFFRKPTDFNRYSVVVRAIEQFCEKLEETKWSDLTEESIMKVLELEKEARRKERLKLKTKIWDLERKLAEEKKKLVEEKQKVEDLKTELDESKNAPQLKDILPPPLVFDPSAALLVAPADVASQTPDQEA